MRKQKIAPENYVFEVMLYMLDSDIILVFD
jgi:hypothetical protein